MAELQDLIYHFSNDGLNINVEVRPLVKCKDCKWYLKDADNTGYCKVCEGFAIDIPQHDEGYCSYGERKGHNNEAN